MVELWIFITASCLFSACVGAIAGHVATRWGMSRDLEVVAERKDVAVEAALGTAFELQRVSGDHPAVELYDQDAEQPVARAAVCPEAGGCRREAECAETGCHWRRLDALNRGLIDDDRADTLPRVLPDGRRSR